jgi:hypothetical protein
MPPEPAAAPSIEPAPVAEQVFAVAPEPAPPPPETPTEPAPTVSVASTARPALPALSPDRSAPVGGSSRVESRARRVTQRPSGVEARRSPGQQRREAATRPLRPPQAARRPEAPGRARAIEPVVPRRWVAALVASAVAIVLIVLGSFGQWALAAWRLSELFSAEPLSSAAPVSGARPAVPGRAAGPKEVDPTTPAVAPGARVPDVQTVDEAFALATDERPEAHAAALAFLERHGPDARAYELLADLDAERGETPVQTVELIARRSRVRRTLCSAWADDPRGEAPVRLGCPGASRPPD